MQRDAQSSNTTNHLCVPVAKLLVQPSLVLLEPYQERLQSIPQTSSVAIHHSRIQLQQQPSTAHSHFVATSLVHPGLSWHGSQCLHSLLEIQAASSALLGCGILMAPMLQPPGPQQPRLVGLAWPGTAQLLGQAQAMFSRHNPPALPPPFPGDRFGPDPLFSGPLLAETKGSCRAVSKGCSATNRFFHTSGHTLTPGWNQPRNQTASSCGPAPSLATPCALPSSTFGWLAAQSNSGPRTECGG